MKYRILTKNGFYKVERKKFMADWEVWHEDRKWYAGSTEYPFRFKSLDDAISEINHFKKQTGGGWEIVSEEEIALRQLKK